MKPVWWCVCECSALHGTVNVFTVLVKSTAVGWTRTGCGCLNILLPVRSIYNVPMHGPLSAVSNLHLREHFGTGMDGWIEGWPGRHERHKP